MGELEKYGLLSLGSVAVLFLILTFVHRDMESSELKRLPYDGPEEPVVLLAAPPDAQVPRRAPSHRPPSQPASNRAPDRGLQGREEPAPARSTPPPPTTTKAMATTTKAMATKAPPPAPSVEARPTVRVERGDTLYGIAERELGAARRWPEIVALNGHVNPTRLRVGDTLVLPPRAAAVRAPADPAASPPRRAERRLPTPKARMHRIVGGDTLSGIAYRYYGDARLWNRILQANRAKISDPRKLRLGVTLNLP